MPDRLFRDRRDAGRSWLASSRSTGIALTSSSWGLPRGGVPVAYEVATALGAPLDVFVVRKLGVPGREELAMGAIASGGVTVINDDVVRGLGIPPEAIEQVAEREGRELLRREQAYREGRPFPEVTGKVVIVVDDGLATGSSMRARDRGAAAAAARPDRGGRAGRAGVHVPGAGRARRPRWSARRRRRRSSPSGALTGTSPRRPTRRCGTCFARPRASRPAAVSAPGPTEVAVIRAEAVPVADGRPADHVLFDLVGDAHFVLIGEASHGTSEFYEARARMTRRLIEEHGFCAVAAEADWPDAYRVNRYVRGLGEDVTAEEALRGFERFPVWMWRNTAVLDFVGWLRDHNDRPGRGERAKAGFYGLDLYSLYRSVHEVISYLDRVDPAAAARARAALRLFRPLQRRRRPGLRFRGSFRGRRRMRA